MLSEKEKIRKLYLKEREKAQFDELTEDENFTLLLVNDNIRESETFRYVIFGLCAMHDNFQWTHSRLLGERLVKIADIIQEGMRIIKNESKAQNNATYAPNP